MRDIRLRDCTYEDCKYIYKLANDKIYRQFSFNSNFIEYEEHKNWFIQTMKNSKKNIYIVSYKNQDVGEVVIEIIDGNFAEISYVLETDYRGKGIGTKALSLISKKVMSEFSDVKILLGKVKKENIASRKAFLKNSYIETEKEDFYEYTLSI